MNRLSRWLGVATLLVALSGCSATSKCTKAANTAAVAEQVGEATGPLAAGVTDIVSGLYGTGGFNGAVLMARDGEAVFKHAYGLADREWQTPNTTDAVFRIGSLTKSFTAVLVLQAAERGELALDGTISQYLPYYREDTGGRVTVHHLLSHTAGIPEHLGALFADPSLLTRTYTPEDFVTRFCSADLANEPGETFAYSNSNYVILGAILEAVTKQPYAQLVVERIFEPAGMKASHYEQPAVIKARRARGYMGLESGGYQNAPYYDLSVAFAAGALTSTVDDLLAFDRALELETLLKKASVAKLWTPVTANYGYGWEVYQKPLVEGAEPITVTGHAGSTFGFHANLLRAPTHKALVVVLSNTQPAKVRELTEALMALLLSQ